MGREVLYSRGTTQIAIILARLSKDTGLSDIPFLVTVEVSASTYFPLKGFSRVLRSELRSASL